MYTNRYRLSGQDGKPLYELVSEDEEYNPKLCFATCHDLNYIPGSVGLIKSIRRFYSPSEADIIVYLASHSPRFERFCDQNDVEVRYYHEFEEWVIPLVYQDPVYAQNTRHLYHPHVDPLIKGYYIDYPDEWKGSDCEVKWFPGFDRLRHLHPFRAKAYCIGDCLCMRNYRRAVYIDADAFLLARVDAIFEEYDRPSTLIAADDGGTLGPLDVLYGVSLAAEDIGRYCFNGGVLYFINGRSMKDLARDLMFYTESSVHYRHSGTWADQGLLRAVVAVHELRNSGLAYHKIDGTNWNPCMDRAEQLRFDPVRKEWINLRNNRKQHVVHTSGRPHLWTGSHPSESLNRAWRWIGGSYGNDWHTRLLESGAPGLPFYESIKHANDHVDKLCFTTCLDPSDSPQLEPFIGFRYGAMGLIRSIRKFYSPQEADIIVFVNGSSREFEQFCLEQHAELHHADDMDEWVQPLVYEDPKYATNTLHYYHPDFKPAPNLPYHENSNPGFGRIHHKHAVNLRVYCSGYCLCVRNYRYVAYIEPDAFLLSRVDEIYQKYAEPNEVVGFVGPGREDLANLEPLFGVAKPSGFDPSAFRFSSSLLFYSNGPGVKNLARDLIFYMESCYHYDNVGSTSLLQAGVLRNVMAKHAIQGGVRFNLEDSTHWCPPRDTANELSFDDGSQSWINRGTGQRQRVWRSGIDGEIDGYVWSRGFPSMSVNTAWQWIGGPYAPWHSVQGCLSVEACEYVASRVAAYFSDEPGKRIDILEIGTLFGRSAVGWVELLRQFGFDVRVDTCDAYTWLSRSPEVVRANIRRFGMEDQVTVHQVGLNENLIRRFQGKKFDFIYIDGSHEYKSVLSDCVMGLKMAKERAVVAGDDFAERFQDVIDAVRDIFREDAISVMHEQWMVYLDGRQSSRPNCEGGATQLDTCLVKSV